MQKVQIYVDSTRLDLFKNVTVSQLFRAINKKIEKRKKCEAQS